MYCAWRRKKVTASGPWYLSTRWFSARLLCRLLYPTGDDFFGEIISLDPAGRGREICLTVLQPLLLFATFVVVCNLCCCLQRLSLFAPASGPERNGHFGGTMNCAWRRQKATACGVGQLRTRRFSATLRRSGLLARHSAALLCSEARSRCRLLATSSLHSVSVGGCRAAQRGALSLPLACDLVVVCKFSSCFCSLCHCFQSLSLLAVFATVCSLCH